MIVTGTLNAQKMVELLRRLPFIEMDQQQNLAVDLTALTLSLSSF